MTTPPTGHPAALAPDAYRVLVVEDDPSQAVFAEAILRGAGMRVEAVTDPARAMDALERFRPDVVLMDVHMPGIGGVELTARIRGRAGFEDTPVVLLSGDTDPEREVEALERGGDDYLIKPVRPRHLIAAIQSRARRVRELAGRRHANGHPTPLQALEQPVAGGHGGALLLEIANATALRDRYGFAAFEQLMAEAGQLLAAMPGQGVVAPLGENAFVRVLPAHDPSRLEDAARTARDHVGRHVFHVGGEALRLRCSVGHADLGHRFPDATAALAALEDAARSARANPVGLAGYQPRRDGPTAQLADALADAQGGPLYLAFQPVVAVQGNDGAQFQVLVRMRDGNGSAMQARDLLPLAVASGLLPELDRWVMREALALLRRRHEENLPLRLFVSQSARTLTRDDFAPGLLQALADAGIDGRSLVLDIRMDDARVHALTLQQAGAQLAEAGVRFCLSQYREDGDAEALLQRLPLAFVRLDVAFAAQPLQPALREELARIIDAAHDRDIRVIAHAVEDPRSAAELWGSGVDYLQGNLVHRAHQAPDYDFGSSTL